LESFPSNFRWYVTGTPFPNRDVIIGVLHFLGVESSNPTLNLSKSIKENNVQIGNERNGADLQKEYEYWVLFDLVVNNFTWRNTKSSVSSQIDIPEYSESLVLLEFTPVERAVYNYLKEAGKYEKMNEICVCLFFWVGFLFIVCF